MTQRDEEMLTNISSNVGTESLQQDNNHVEIVTKNSTISLVSDNSSVSTSLYLPPIIDVRSGNTKDKERDSRQVRALKSKLDRLSSSTTKVQERLSLDHCQAIEIFATKTMVFRVDIVDFKKKDVDP